MTRTARHARLFAGLGSLAVLGVLAGCAGASDTAESTPAVTSGDATAAETEAATDSDAATGSESTEDTGSDSDAAGIYDDGTYTASGSYVSPGGTETVEVEVTVTGDVVTAVEVTPQATNRTSVQFQTQFASGISDEVVGVALDDLEVDRVAGSSLTSGGFNEAIETIKAEAGA